jgi:hypothetical protein
MKKVNNPVSVPVSGFITFDHNSSSAYLKKKKKRLFLLLLRTGVCSGFACGFGVSRMR